MLSTLSPFNTVCSVAALLAQLSASVVSIEETLVIGNSESKQKRSTIKMKSIFPQN